MRGQKISARRENLINIHALWLENGRIRACAAEQRSILTQLGPISCRSVLTRATATGFCTTGKCIASLLAFINLFIACDVKKALK